MTLIPNERGGTQKPPAARWRARLTGEQKAALIAVYDSMLGSGRNPDL